MHRRISPNQITVEQVVDGIIAELPLAARVDAAYLDQDEFRMVELILCEYIRYRLDQLATDINEELMQDCIGKYGNSMNEGDAATVIIKELWDRLRKTHRIRVVK
ncbi:MAG: hypothetical protein PVF37_14845 [Desulfobacterales bacterium]|jgi:hypothetical protein